METIFILATMGILVLLCLWCGTDKDNDGGDSGYFGV